MFVEHSDEEWGELFTSAHEVVLQNGFDPANWDNLLAKSFLAIGELDELVEGIEKGIGVENLREEIADTAIRLGCLLRDVFPGEWNFRHPHEKSCGGLVFMSPSDFVRETERYIVKAGEAWRLDRVSDVRIALELAMKGVFRMAQRIDCDLFQSIRAKTEVNAQRGRFHGKRTSLG